MNKYGGWLIENQLFERDRVTVSLDRPGQKIKKLDITVEELKELKEMIDKYLETCQQKK